MRWRQKALRVLAAAAALVILSTLPATAQDNPDTGRGFQADKVYQFGQLDTVNLFNGNLSLMLPLGGSYPVNGNLAYALTLTYNSNIWRFNNFQWWQPGGGIIGSQVASLERTNAGPGWRLTLGELQDVSYALNDGTQWVYIAQDGAHHAFYDTLHVNEAAQSGVSYTRDGSYLRLVRELSTAYRVEFPDGSKHRFVRDSSSPSSPFRLDYLEDVYGNRLTVSYPSSLHWTLSDGHRTHDVYFRTYTIDSSTWTVVDRVELAAFGGARATYGFSYTQLAVQESAYDDYSGSSAFRNAYLLSGISLPDGSSWGMSYYTLRSETNPDSTSENQGGVLKKLTLPTLGAYEWTYQDYQFPSRVAPGAPGTLSLSLARSTGVKTKRMLDADGQCYEVGQNTSTDARVGCEWSYAWGQNLGIFERTTVVTDPAGDETKHYFDVHPRPDTTGWSGWEYGLAFTTAVSDGLGHYLSQQIYDGSVATGTLMREIYVAYERDKLSNVDLAPQYWENSNRRPQSRRVLYKDDGTHYRQQASSDFDGLGHYRTVQASGSLPGGGTRTMTTKYNDGRGSYNVNLAANTVSGSYQSWSTGSPWVLGTFSETRVTESGATAVVQSCFDAATGRLKRQRTWKGTSPGADDVMVLYGIFADGNLRRERYYGGDGQALSTSSDLCSLPVPSPELYNRLHAYSYGARSSTSWRSESDSNVLTTLNRTIDTHTGLPKRDYDVSGLYVDYDYDLMGRPLWEKPQSGHGGWTEYQWRTATSASSKARAEIFHLPNGGGAPLAQSRLTFDAFGRPWRDMVLSAEGPWTRQDTVYDALGRQRSVSERQTGYPDKLTVYKQYDPFGRPHRIEPPDDPSHRVLVWYAGERNMQREVKVCQAAGGCPSSSQEAESYVSERYDRHGRLYQVIEESGPGGAEVTTTYQYDVGNRLRQVSTSAEDITQVRLFNYDGRGFLISERHPEKGTTGDDGYVNYSKHDPMGHPGKKVDGTFDLRYVYDRAGRLSEVDEQTYSGLRPAKVFHYEVANSGANLRKGKLGWAERYNYVTLNSVPYTVLLRETYEYADRGGAVSRRDTEMWVNGSPAESFTQGFAWNELGDAESLDYPQCTHAACSVPSPRTVSFGYTQGFLTNVPGFGAMSYHPNGMVSQVDHDNGVTDTVALDASGMARPASISTSGANSNWSTGAYRYDGAGNITGIGSSNYTYDGVNRLTRAVTYTGQLGSGNGYTRTYDYDTFGNLTEIAGTGGSTIPVNAATNRLSGAVSYDAAGNVTGWNLRYFSYDAFGMMWRQARFDGNDPDGFEDWLYFYTADDERFWSYHKSGSEWKIRDLAGNVLRHYHSGVGGWTLERDYVYRGAQLLAAVEPGVNTWHYSLDHLGSPRLITNANGNKRAYHVYYPYGEEATAWNQDTEAMKFTAHERDFTDAGGPGDDLDYMHARYFGPAVGRFFSFDPVGGNPRNPRSWNRYAYVLGNPLRFTDPLGLKEVDSCSRSTEGNVSCNGSVSAGNNKDPNRPFDALSFFLFVLGRPNNGGNTVDRALTNLTDSYQEQFEYNAVEGNYFAAFLDFLAPGLLPANSAELGVEVAMTVVPPLKGGKLLPRGLTRSFNYAVRKLGLNKRTASQVLHAVKHEAGRGPADNVVFDLATGNILDPDTGTIIGNLADDYF